jgi:hypothetical protein
MRSRQVTEYPEQGVNALIPPPVEDGTDELESLGTFIDNLLGAGRDHRAVLATMESLIDRDHEPKDPPPVEAPSPVPDGTETETRGGR